MSVNDVELAIVRAKVRLGRDSRSHAVVVRRLVHPPAQRLRRSSPGGGAALSARYGLRARVSPRAAC